jgi:hypothetical protein
MTIESTVFAFAMCIAGLTLGVQLGALWGARVERSEARKREELAYDEGFDHGAGRQPRRWHR